MPNYPSWPPHVEAVCKECGRREVVSSWAEDLWWFYPGDWDPMSMTSKLIIEEGGWLPCANGRGAGWQHSENEWLYYCKRHGEHFSEPSWCCENEDFHYYD